MPRRVIIPQAAIYKRMQDALASTIEGLAFEVERQVKTERAPVDSGELRAGVHTESKLLKRNVRSRVMTGEGQDYAAIQHEGTWYTHPLGGESKYMENALKAVGAQAAIKLKQSVQVKL